MPKTLCKVFSEQDMKEDIRLIKIILFQFLHHMDLDLVSSKQIIDLLSKMSKY